MAISALCPTLRVRPVLGYKRKSKEDKDAQKNSLERQAEAITGFVRRNGWGEVDYWFEDEQSGKNFARPGYDALLSFCRANPQPKTALGRIVCNDYDRFSRPVDASLRMDPIEYQRQVIILHDLGWELDFVETPKSGNRLLDGLSGSLKSIMAGEYIEKLSIGSRSGKRKSGTQGFWQGGPPPFPTVRYDARTGTMLQRGQRAGNAASVLGLDPNHPEYLEAWEEGAQMLLAGHSLDEVAARYDERQVPNFYRDSTFRDGRRRGLSWRHANIAKLYTNPALIGKVEYEFTNDDGSTDPFVGDAQWPPLVDVALFTQVRDLLVNRRERGIRAPATRKNVLELECYACGAHYVAATFRSRARDAGGRELRNYTHPVPESRMNPAQAEKTRAAGCRHWYVPADEVERIVRDVIVSKRGSQEFMDYFVDLIDNQQELVTLTKKAEQLKQAALDRLEEQQGNLLQSMRFARTDKQRQAIADEQTRLEQELEAAAASLDQARLRTRSAKQMSKDLLKIVAEAENIESTWNQPGQEGLAARRAIVATWVHTILVEVIPVEGRPRSSRKLVHVFLRTTPDQPETRALMSAIDSTAAKAHPSACASMECCDVVVVELAA